jgi:hypothetical protein
MPTSPNLMDRLIQARHKFAQRVLMDRARAVVQLYKATA